MTDYTVDGFGYHGGTTTSYAQCIECGRGGSIGLTWFYMNSWGPICGLCWYKLTGRQEVPEEAAKAGWPP